jgi:hypothetical protein
MSLIWPSMNEQEISCSSHAFKHYLQTCTTTGTKLFMINAKRLIERDLLSTESPYEVKDSILIR